MFDNFNPLALKIAAITLPLHFLCFIIYLVISRRKKKAHGEDGAGEPRLVRRRSKTATAEDVIPLGIPLDATPSVVATETAEKTETPVVDQKAATEEIPPPTEPAEENTEAPISLRGLIGSALEAAPEVAHPTPKPPSKRKQRLVAQLNAQGKTEIVVVTDDEP